MELRHLKYFVTLAEELHFARAAERLNIAPPTLTVQIQEIERTLSARLFVRTKRSVALTPAGEIFLVEARNAIAQFARAESVGRRAGRGELGRVEIGYVGSAAYAGVLQDQTSRFTRAWPNVHVNARELPMDELPLLIAEDQIDIGFVRLPVKLPKSLLVHVLLHDYYCVASPVSGQEIDRKPVRPAQLANQWLIMPEQEAGTFEVAKRGRFVPKIASAPGGLLAVLTQVSLGMGRSVVPSVVRDIVRLPGVTYQKLSGEPIPSQVAAIFRSDDSSAATRNFINQIEETPAQALAPHDWE